jgi:hypothetical protein
MPAWAVLTNYFDMASIARSRGRNLPEKTMQDMVWTSTIKEQEMRGPVAHGTFYLCQQHTREFLAISLDDALLAEAMALEEGSCVLYERRANSSLSYIAFMEKGLSLREIRQRLLVPDFEDRQLPPRLRRF